MSKLYISDHLGVHKTTIQIEKWFSTHGHEVHWNMYYEPREAEWCDVMMFEWLEGMVELCLKAGWGKKKPVYCRAMDIEIWANNANGADLTDLSGLAYTSKAMYDILQQSHPISAKYPKLKTQHIPLSVDMNEWTYKKREPGYNVAVIGHMWDSKGPNMIPQFVKKLVKETSKPWKFYVQGYWRHDVWRWYLEYFNHIVKELGLQENIILSEERIPDMNQWMEKMNYLVTFSMKDAFSLIVGEAMAKGIKALPHNFLGSKDIWGKYVWSDFDELTKMMMEPYNSEEYYQFVKDHYSNEVVMPVWSKFLGI